MLHKQPNRFEFLIQLHSPPWAQLSATHHHQNDIRSGKKTHFFSIQEKVKCRSCPYIPLTSEASSKPDINVNFSTCYSLRALLFREPFKNRFYHLTRWTCPARKERDGDSVGSKKRVEWCRICNDVHRCGDWWGFRWMGSRRCSGRSCLIRYGLKERSSKLTISRRTMSLAFHWTSIHSVDGRAQCGTKRRR